ncbi:MAG: hypothetical protein BWZ10_02086 [candidate division BRC1 bacterium ADurb.BinA364]|nr:MAG: hypothetical protein BWZ10_02086 [candidate division BRC1 bacterium ADurb.BinA364]
MRHAAGQLADRLQLLRMQQLLFEPLALILGALAIGDVQRRQNPDALHPLALDGRGVEQDIQLRFIASGGGFAARALPAGFDRMRLLCRGRSAPGLQRRAAFRFVGEQRGESRAMQRLGRQAKHPVHPLVGPFQPPFAHHRNPDGRGTEHALQRRLAGAQRFLALAALLDHLVGRTGQHAQFLERQIALDDFVARAFDGGLMEKALEHGVLAAQRPGEAKRDGQRQRAGRGDRRHNAPQRALNPALQTLRQRSDFAVQIVGVDASAHDPPPRLEGNGKG